MGFWKNLGKIGLKVAPYAAMAIPGVGVPLGMALQGGLSALDTKVSGGSWKNALLSGGMGAATSGIGAGALKGIGPSSKALTKILGGAGGVEGLGATGAIGKVLGDMGRNAAGAQLSKVGPQSVQMPPPEIPQQYNPNADVMAPFQPQSPGLADSIFAGRQNARKRSAFA